MPTKTDYWGFETEVERDGRTSSSEAFMRSDVFGGILFTQWLPRTFTVKTTSDFRSVSLNAKQGDALYYTAASGVIWQFAYLPDESSYPWKFIGGPPLMSEVATGEARLSNVFGDLATVGPSITLPFDGDYDIEIGAEGFENTTGGQAAMSYDIGGTAASTNDEARITTTSNFYGTLRRTRRKTGLTAASAIVAKYLGSSSNATFRSRIMIITPDRVR